MSNGNWGRHVASSLVTIAMVFLAFGSSKPDDKDTSSTPEPVKPSTPNVSGDRTITGEDFVGCTSKDDNDKLTEYAVQKDYAAFNKYLAVRVVGGRCIKFTQGESVFVTDTAILSGLVKLRRKGQIQEYWTNLEAIQTSK